MTDSGAAASLAVQRRREGAREEFSEQVRLIGMLEELLDPKTVWWSALENRPRSAQAGAFQRKRGVKSGLADLMAIAIGAPPVFIEMKSRRGVPSKTQRRVFAELQAKGAAVYVARSADAALEALRRHVPFRCPWEPPAALADWEGPFSGSFRRLPQEPTVAAERRATLRAWRERQRARKGRAVGVY